MKKSIFYTFGLALAAIAFASCDDFLDKMPDSRAELDTEEKVVKMLVSAYPDNTYNMCAEFSSDNVDDYGSIKSYNQLQEELYNWQEVSSVETNENPNAVWGDAYTAIAAANQALAAIEELGGAKTAKLQAAKGEALICRAYAHWVLVNMFCMHYNTNHPDDLGVPYMEHAETELNPKYSRGTVARSSTTRSTRLPSTISTTRPPAASHRASSCSTRTGTTPSNTQAWRSGQIPNRSSATSITWPHSRATR